MHIKKSTKITLLIPTVLFIAAATCEIGSSICETECLRSKERKYEWCEKDCGGEQNYYCVEGCKGEADDQYDECMGKCEIE